MDLTANAIYRVEDEEGRQQSINEARLKGFTVVIADDWHLLLDIDSQDIPKEFWSILSMCFDRFGIVVEDIWLSKSGNNHIVIKLDRPLPVLYRIALQSILGSDPRRDIMSLCSVEIGVKDPILLFKPAPKLLRKP